MTEKLLTVADVAKYAQLSEATVRAMARTGRMPGYCIGRVWRFDPAEIEGWLKSHSNTATATAEQESEEY